MSKECQVTGARVKRGRKYSIRGIAKKKRVSVLKLPVRPNGIFILIC